MWLAVPLMSSAQTTSRPMSSKVIERGSPAFAVLITDSAVGSTRNSRTTESASATITSLAGVGIVASVGS